MDQACFPGGTNRNWASYGDKVSLKNDLDRYLLADPQTSGGLLIAVDPGAQDAFELYCQDLGYVLEPIGEFVEGDARVMVE